MKKWIFGFVVVVSGIILIAAQTYNPPSGASGVASIVGGTIDGAVIGGTTPASGSLTTLGLTNYISAPCVAGFGGVTANTIVTYGAGGTTCFPAASGSNNALGIAISSAAQGVTFQVAEIGYVNSGCIADNTWVTGDLLSEGTTTPSHCKDLGTAANSAVISTMQIVGRAMAACTAGTSCPLFTAGIGHFGTLATLPYTVSSLGGSLLAVGCTSGATVPVSNATTAMACVMTGVGGNPANIQPQCSVTSAGTVTPQLCTSVAVTPTAQNYNIRVVP
jgi:hypothetical protein